MFNSEFKKTSFIRASLFASAAIMAVVSLPAMAQTAPAEDDTANAEIIVTAQKREERLQDIRSPYRLLVERQLPIMAA